MSDKESSGLNFRIAQLQDVDNVFDFEMNLQFGTGRDDFENQMAVWASSYRKESLEHYFKTGWSFVAEDRAGAIKGYFLAQPLLFFDSQTQTLWVEKLSSGDASIRKSLVDLAYRLSREKHFQRVLLPENTAQEFKADFSTQQSWDRKTTYLKTTKSL